MRNTKTHANTPAHTYAVGRANERLPGGGGVRYRQGRDNGSRQEDAGDCVIANYRGAPICRDATTRRLVRRINVDAARTLIADAKS